MFKVKKRDDFVIAGYSEGGQTTMGVLREISENHSEIKVKRAFAGDGPYDINSMFDAVTKGETEMPAIPCHSSSRVPSARMRSPAAGRPVAIST